MTSVNTTCKSYFYLFILFIIRPPGTCDNRHAHCEQLDFCICVDPTWVDTCPKLCGACE